MFKRKDTLKKLLIIYLLEVSSLQTISQIKKFKSTLIIHYSNLLSIITLNLLKFKFPQTNKKNSSSQKNRFKTVLKLFSDSNVIHSPIDYITYSLSLKTIQESHLIFSWSKSFDCSTVPMMIKWLSYLAFLILIETDIWVQVM